MDYKNAFSVLPDDLVSAIQRHIDGEYLYIPRKKENKKSWGERSNTRRLLDKRNAAIFAEYQGGTSVQQLANKYYLSKKTIYKILSQIKNNQ